MNVYDYISPLSFIEDYYAEQKLNMPEFSMRKWSKEMGLKSHTLLIMILNGKRKIKIRHLDFLGEGLSLNSSERLYFQTLIQFHNAEDMKEKRLYEHFLSDLNPSKNFKVKELEEYKIVSDWYHMVILAMTELKDFKINPKSIEEKLNGKVTLLEIENALKRLEEMNLITRIGKDMYKTTYNRITTKADTYNKGAREYHAQVGNLALKAINEVSIEGREFQSFSMAIAKEKVPLAKELIREFRNKFSKAVSGNGDEIFQTNIQFFQLTESPKQMGDAGVEAELNKIHKEKK